MDKVAPVRRHNACRLVVLIFSLWTGVTALAAMPSAADSQALKQLSLEQLGNIEVTTTSKEPDEVWHTPAAIYVLTSEDIRRSGRRTLPDILRLVPGVEVAQIDSSKFSVGIRGFGTRLSKSVLVLIDGRSVYTPLFAGVYWEMQQTLISDIDRIEVIRGPGGTIWGPNAVNGVINVITKHARDTRGVQITAGGGNVDQGFGSFRYGAGNPDGFNYRLYGRGFTRGPEHHSDGHNFDDWRMGQVGFRADWTYGVRDSFTVSGDAYKEAVGQKLGVAHYTPPSLLFPEANIDLLGQNVVAHWHHQLEGNSDIQVQAYWDRTHRVDLNFEEVRNTVDFDFIHHVGLNRNNVIWGAGVRFSPDHFVQVVPTVDFLPHRQLYSLVTGFLQDEVAIVPKKLSFTIGAKLGWNNYSDFDVQPSARLLYTPAQHQSLWAAVTRAVRTPSRIEENFRFDYLAAPSLPLYLRLIGDNHFVPEKMLGYEAGYRAAYHDRLMVDIAAFYNQYGDLLSVENRPIIQDPATTDTRLILPIFFRNGLEGTTKGFEIAPAFDVTRKWRFKTSYSYLSLNVNRKSWSDDASSERQEEGASPRHMATVQSLLSLPAGFELDVTYRYVGRLAFPLIPSYSTGDARFGWRPTENWELSVTGENLFQPFHYEFSGDPGPLVGIDRSIFAKVTFTK